MVFRGRSDHEFSFAGRQLLLLKSEFQESAGAIIGTYQTTGESDGSYHLHRDA